MKTELHALNTELRNDKIMLIATVATAVIFVVAAIVACAVL